MEVWRIVPILKQSYNLEGLRVRGYTAINKLVALVLAVSYFAAVYLGQNLKLNIPVERISLVFERFFGVSPFFNDAIEDGFYNLLFPDTRGLDLKGCKIEDFQLCFSFW